MKYLKTRQSFLLFVDIIDSSKFSSLLGYEQYGQIILHFNRHFKQLVNIYFPGKYQNKIEYIKFDSYGDEGQLFIALKQGCIEYSEIAYDLISFLFELKSTFILEYENIIENNKYQKSPAIVEFAAGINFGTIGLFEEDGEHKIVGYAINVAKRIENASRQGRYSNIFISKEIYLQLQKLPVFMSKVQADLIGIENNTILYEIMSALVNNMPRSLDDFSEYEAKIDEFAQNNGFYEIKAPWLNSLIISYYNFMYESHSDNDIKGIYNNKIKKFIFNNNLIGQDPILTFIKAQHYEFKNQYVLVLKTLEDLLNKFPNFTKARIWHIETVINVFKKHTNIHDVYFAYESAINYCTNYVHLLNDNDKNTLNSLIEKAKILIDNYDQEIR